MNKIEQTPLIEVKGLKKYFKKNGKTLHAVDDINLTIQRGTTLGVVGESGCGKSTLGRTILRLLKPTEGQVLFEGHDITKVSEAQMRKYRQSMQIIFQDPYSSLNPRKSVAEIIATPLVVNHICKNKAELRKRVKEQDKEIRRLKEENEFLEEASAFFAASRRKSVKNRD